MTDLEIAEAKKNFEAKLLELREIVSKRIDEVLKDGEFKLNIKTLTGIHEKLFHDIYLNNGHFRDFNLRIEEEILYGETIQYADFHTIPAFLQFDIRDELKKDYKSMNKDEIVSNIASFAANLWKTHPFNDGNTRTVCIFIEKYLMSMGLNVDNNVFKENGLYYRDALVKACYKNEKFGIEEDLEPLIKIYKKAIFDRSIELDDKDLDIPGLLLNLEIKRRKKSKTMSSPWIKKQK